MECSKCRKTNPSGSKFCNECGQKLNTNHGIFRVDHLADGERKHATVLFSDLSGYTAMSEKLDPEEVKDIVGRIFEKAGRIVENYEGTVERFFGDEIMALFGVPKTHGDDPVRAIHTAREIHDLVESMSLEFEKRHGIVLKMHTGINTGLMITGEKYIGKDRHGLTGDTINLAKRLTNIAKAGEIVIGPVTYRQSESHFSYQALEPTRVKGKTEPIQVYKVLALKTHDRQQRINLERYIHSEMVGRDKELSKLELQLAKVINGNGSVVNIIGEAGIGKSRLLAEFKNLDALKRVVLIEGKAISIGRNLAFHPIIELLKQWAQIGENDSEAIALSKLESAVRNVSKEDADEIIPFLATLMGMKFSGRYAKRVEGIEGEALEKLILKNVKELLAKASELIPLVIVTEDLHWADSSSIELLELLFPLTESKRILFVNLFRPNHEKTGERVVYALREEPSIYHVEIVLEPLNETKSEKLISNMLKIEGLNYAIKNKVIKRTGGNPFFIEEVIRSFIDEGAIIKREGIFEVTNKIHTMDIPYTINGVLTARIDRLENHTRDLLKTAAVIGRNFFYKIIAEVATNIESIDHRLHYLKDIQIIKERERLGELEYLFKHALAQEAAYESILMQKRKELHLSVAGSIEKIFKDRLHEFYGVLSYHYSNGGDLDKAEEYMLKAGNEALKSSASSEALHYYQKALEIYIKKYGDAVDSVKIADIEENIANAFLNKAHFNEAVEYFDRSLKNRGEKVSGNPLFQIISLITNFLFLLSNIYIFPWKKKKVPTDYDNYVLNRKFKSGLAVSNVDMNRCFVENIKFANNAFKFDLSQSQVVFDAISATGIMLSASGISFKVGKRVLDYVKNCVPDGQTRISFHFHGWCESSHKFLSGEWDGEIDYEVIDHALKIGDLLSASANLYFWAHMNLEIGNFNSCKKIIKKSAYIGDDYNYIHAKMDVYDIRSKYLLKIRNTYEALQSIEDGIEYLNTNRWDMRKLQFLGIKTRILVAMNDLDSSRKTIEEADALYSAIGKYAMIPTFLRDYLLCKMAYSLGRVEASFNTSDSRKLKIDRGTIKNIKIGAKYFKNMAASERTESFRLMGIYYWVNNMQKKALKWWSKSIKAGERLSAKLELSRSYFEVGNRLLQPESKYKDLNGISGIEYLDKARTLFQEMRLQVDLDELDQIVQSN